MYLSLNWLSDFVDVNGIDPQELGLKLTMSTAEIEGIEIVGKDINNVVVGKVLEVQPHPESKKLSIVKVDSGDEVVQCVCGAPNVKEGILAPFAKVGGSVKKLQNIGVVKLAGVDSHGMLCSASELGVSDDHTGLMILEGDYKPGTDIKDIIDIEDIIIEVDNKALTNRPDLWGHYGFAREIAAIYNRKLKPLPIEEVENSLPGLDIVIEDKEKCFRYSGLTIDNVNVKKSNLKMQTRLFYCGMRPISLLVDLSNYIMLEIGQPTHAFDKKFMEKVIVKSTSAPIKFKTLDGIEREIPEDVLMIHNQNGPVGIAGVMGGENTEISEGTNSVFLESANFEGPSTRRNATKLGLRTEASARYEKMLDPELTLLAIKRFVKLVKDADSGANVSSSLTDIVAKQYEKISVTVDKKTINRYMGFEISNERIAQILESLEFKVNKEGDIFKVDVPSFRATKDVSIKADIIEEITRIYGYDNIDPQPIKADLVPLKYNEDRIIDHKVKELLSENYGYSEVHSHIWYDNKSNSKLGLGERDGLKILNSFDGNNGTLRDSLAPIMINFASENKKNYDQFGIFEIGGVFSIKDKKDLCDEHKNLCLLIASKSESEDNLFYKAKGIITSIMKTIKKVELQYIKADKILEYSWVHPIKAAQVYCNGEELGYISVIHPKVKENVDKKLSMTIIELNMFKVHNIKEGATKFVEPSKYPEVTLDLSLLVDNDISFDKINLTFGEYKNELLVDYKFVDIYTGKGVPEGKKSMTFSFRIGSKEHTLSSEEIEAFRQNILSYATSKGYVLR